MLLSYRNLFVATLAVCLIAGGGLGALWAHYLVSPAIVAPSGGQVFTSTVTVGIVQTSQTASATQAISTTATGESQVPKVTVDLGAGSIYTGLIENNIADVIVYLTITNPSDSPITISSVEYEVWINNFSIGKGALDKPVTIGNGASDVRTVIPRVDYTKLPQSVQDALTLQVGLGGGGRMRIQGILHIAGGFGTADVPFQGEGEMGIPIAT
jgi:LEA14-like dessication related protein